MASHCGTDDHQAVGPFCVVAAPSFHGSLDEPEEVALSEVYRFAGVEYRLPAIVDGRYFRGRWRCGACEQERGSDAKYATAGLAVFAARADLAEHHKIAHSGELPGALRSE